MDKTKKKQITVIAVTIVILAVILGLYLGLPVDKRYTNIIFGGLSMQTVINTNITNQTPVGNKLYEAVTKVDKLVNPKMETSDIYLINHSKVNQPIKVDSLTIELLEISKDVFDRTGGLYNPASYTLVDIWGFSAEKFNPQIEHTVPSDKDIELGKQLAQKFADIQFIDKTTSAEQIAQYKANATFLVDKVNNTVTRTDNCFINNPYADEKLGAMIDLGGIAKGYASELCYNVFKGSVAKNGLVNIGGNVYSYNKDWKVGIENPFKNNKLDNGEQETNIFGVITLNNLSVSCSGVYERNYKIGNDFYHHIINTSTGKPQEIQDNSIVMAGVIGKNGAICDAVATSLVLMGSVEKVEQFISTNYTEEIQAVILVTNSKQYKIIGNIPFILNDTELVGFSEIK